jgi:transketolase
MAIAQAWLAATYNRPGFTLFEHRVFAPAGDGDMMEGMSAEAASLAGHLKLSRLCWLYDCNHISIEGSTSLTFTEEVGARFVACGWQVLHVADANDIEATALALATFERTHDRPTLVVVDSHIGYGAPHKQDSAAAHGEPLGVDEARGAKEFYGCDPDASFAVPDGVTEHFSAQFGRRGTDAHAAWRARFAAYRAQYPDLAAQLDQIQRRELPVDWDALLPEFETDAKGLAPRDASGQVLNAIASHVPWLLGGAALIVDFAGTFEPASSAGRNFHFGIREHAMCAVASGMALSGLRAYASTFLVFTDYARGAIRLAAMMGLPVIYVWTHDSIAMGEDGPTHQPVEQLASFRATPGMVTLRPADANEVVEAWRVVMALKDSPASLVLTRQALPTLDRSRYASASGVARGAYVLADSRTPEGLPAIILLASGSEVALCIAAHEQLRREGVASRVISMPSWELFERQDEAYRENALPPAVHARVSVEAAAALGWDRYVGSRGTIIAMRGFGLSAPGKVVQAHFGFDVDSVLAAARHQLAFQAARA